jgi:hypothetical protein
MSNVGKLLAWWGEPKYFRPGSGGNERRPTTTEAAILA